MTCNLEKFNVHKCCECNAKAVITAPEKKTPTSTPSTPLCNANSNGYFLRVFELGKSEIMSNREDLSSCLTIEDISLSLPEDVRNILESYRSDLATYEQISFLVENSSPGHIVLSKEENDSRLEGKLLKYNGKTFKIEPFATQVGLK